MYKNVYIFQFEKKPGQKKNAFEILENLDLIKNERIPYSYLLNTGYYGSRE